MLGFRFFICSLRIGFETRKSWRILEKWVKLISSDPSGGWVRVVKYKIKMKSQENLIFIL